MKETLSITRIVADGISVSVLTRPARLSCWQDAQDDVITLFTDGSSRSQTGGYAFILRINGKEELGIGFESDADHNRMELLAVAAALCRAREHCKVGSLKRVQVFSDSAYVIERASRAKYVSLPANTNDVTRHLDGWDSIAITLKTVDVEWRRLPRKSNGIRVADALSKLAVGVVEPKHLLGAGLRLSEWVGFMDTIPWCELQKRCIMQTLPQKIGRLERRQRARLF